MAGDDAVPENMLSIETEPRGPVRHERVELDERSWIQQQIQALPCGQLPERVLALDANRTTSQEGLVSHVLELCEPFVARGHVRPPRGASTSALGRDGPS